jgi:exosortase/archaeosortase family protein
MEKIERFKKYFGLYRPVSYYLLVLVIVLPFYPILRQYLLNSDAKIILLYGNFLEYTSNGVLKLLGIDNSFLQIALSEGLLKINTILMSLWQSFILIFGCCFLPVRICRRALTLLACIGFIIIFNVLRIILIAKGLTDWTGINVEIVNGLMIMILNLTCLVAGYYWFKKNFALKKMFIARLKFNKATLKQVIRNLFLAIGIIIIVNFLAFAQVSPIISFLSMGILNLSHYILSIAGYHTEITGRLIQNSQAAIYFSDTCLGLDLILIYASFIAVLGGKLANKIWFIGLGVIIIYVLNILRISLIFMYLVHNRGRYDLALDIHDIYTYSVYAVTFLLWAVWINKFNKPIEDCFDTIKR